MQLCKNVRKAREIFVSGFWPVFWEIPQMWNKVSSWKGDILRKLRVIGQCTYYMRVRKICCTEGSLSEWSLQCSESLSVS